MNSDDDFNRGDTRSQPFDAKSAYERALAEATNMQQELLTWIDNTDDVKPIGIVDPSPSQFRSVTRNVISNI